MRDVLGGFLPKRTKETSLCFVSQETEAIEASLLEGDVLPALYEGIV